MTFLAKNCADHFVSGQKISLSRDKIVPVKTPIEYWAPEGTYFEDDDNIEWYYHGNKIAYSNHGVNGDILFSFCGWPTASTKLRLNALADRLEQEQGLLKHGRFHTKQGDLYYGSIMIDPNHYYRFYYIDEIAGYAKRNPEYYHPKVLFDPNVCGSFSFSDFEKIAEEY